MPLSKIKVLELGRVFSGPLCGMMLADLGAQVIKVEAPGIGDESRSFGAHRTDGNSCYFNSLNRGKQSIELNLKDKKDRALFIELILKADVLVHNWIQASLDKLGFSYSDVKAINPRLIYCSISGYGHGTSCSDKPSQDIIAQAISGFMSLTGEREGVPLKTGIPVVDYVTGQYAAFAIMSALFMRQSTGEGRFVTASLLGSAVAMTSFSSSAYLSTGVETTRTGNRHPSICPYNLYKTLDGKIVLAVANDKMWQRLCKTLDLNHLARDEKYHSNAARLKHQNELEAILSKQISKLSTQKALDAFKTAKISCAPVNSLKEAFSCLEVDELDMLLKWNSSTKVAGSPFYIEGLSTKTTAPPQLGQDNESIRRIRNWP